MISEISNKLTKSKTNLLKFVCSIFIIIHHCSYYFENNVLRDIFQPFGYLPVCIFLFLSGFGLMESLKIKENYLNRFYLRIIKIIIPALIIFIPYLIYNLIQKNNISIKSFINGQVNYGHYWYVFSIIILYLLFFFAFKFIRNERVGIIILFCELVVYIILFYLLNFGSYWYYTIFAFLSGIVYSFFINIDKVNKNYNKFNLFVLICTFVISILLIYLKYNYIKLGINYNGVGVGITLTISFIFPICVMSLLFYFPNIKNNSYVNCYYEIFLVHNLYVSLFVNKFANMNVIATFCLLIITYITSLILSALNKKIIKLIP